MHGVTTGGGKGVVGGVVGFVVCHRSQGELRGPATSTHHQLFLSINTPDTQARKRRRNFILA